MSSPMLAPTVDSMSTMVTQHPRRLGSGAIFKQLGQNYIYVLTGLPIAIFSFSLLLSLTVISLATVVVGLGMLLLPLTLLIASAFASLSRSRLSNWGATHQPVRYRPYGPGIGGKFRILSDPRRWLDLVFEMLIAFPLRLSTFMLSVTWTVVGLGGMTYFFWSVFIPGQRSLIVLLQNLYPSATPQSTTGQYLLDSAVYFAIGATFVITLPQVMRALAELDATLTRALLGSRQQAELRDHDNKPLTPHDSVGESNETSFSAAAWALTGTIFAAVVLLAVGAPVVATVYDMHPAISLAWITLHCGAIVLTLYWALPGLVVSLVASGALMYVTASADSSIWPWPVTGLLTQCAILIVAGLASRWYNAVAGWSAGVLLTIAVLLNEAPGLPAGAVTNSIVFASVSAGVVLAATLSRLWLRNAGRLQAAERTSAIQDRKSKGLAERNRIARELHDVVAHSMSVISVQAATAQYRNPGMDEEASREFNEIASSSRQALGEMRMLLSILRNDDDAPTAPSPRLEDIHSLVEATRASGTVIHYRGLDPEVDGPLGDIAPGIALAAYRIVQEALSNALRHSPGSEVDAELSITTAPDNTVWVNIAVTNGAHEQKASAPGSRLGLEGIRERTTAVGGRCQFGPTPEGGFAVTASLPL